MARKTKAQQAVEGVLFIVLSGVAAVAWLVTTIIRDLQQHPVKACFLIFLLVVGFIIWAVLKAKSNKAKKERSLALQEKFKSECEDLINQVKKWDAEGLPPIENPNLNLPKEKIYFQEPFAWKNVGGKKENKGFLYITDKSLRLVSNTSSQIKFEKIMRFEHGKYHFTIYPDNNKAILFLPRNGEIEFDQYLIVARFFAIWKIADGNLFRDFSQDLYDILGINVLEKEQKNEHN